MKIISLELTDDIADWLMGMDSRKRLLILKFMNSLERESDWKRLFVQTSDQAKKQGLTEDELNRILKK